MAPRNWILTLGGGENEKMENRWFLGGRSEGKREREGKRRKKGKKIIVERERKKRMNDPLESMDLRLAAKNAKPSDQTFLLQRLIQYTYNIMTMLLDYS